MAKVKDLLELLGLTHNEFISYLQQNEIDYPSESLADAAFRLRDEVVNLDGGILFGAGLSMIFNKLFDIKKCGVPAFVHWAEYESQPKHWIIAALIAQWINDNKGWSK